MLTKRLILRNDSQSEEAFEAKTEESFWDDLSRLAVIAAYKDKSARFPTPDDSGKIGVSALVLCYNGRGENRRLKRAYITEVDFGNVNRGRIEFYSNITGPIVYDPTVPQVIVVSDELRFRFSKLKTEILDRVDEVTLL